MCVGRRSAGPSRHPKAPPWPAGSHRPRPGHRAGARSHPAIGCPSKRPVRWAQQSTAPVRCCVVTLQKGGTPVRHTGVHGDFGKFTHVPTHVPHRDRCAPLMWRHLSARTQVVCTQVVSALRWPGLRWPTWPHQCGGADWWGKYRNKKPTPAAVWG